MTKQNLLKYISHTPINFNPSVFSSLLDEYISNIQQFYQKSNLTKIENYLYSINYDKIDYSAGEEYCQRFYPKLGGCSAVRKGAYYGRNYDWYYDNSVSFVVKTSSTSTRHASIGVAAVSQLNKSLVEGLTWSDFYAALPFMMLDGINDAGVVCNINVAPNGDYGYTVGTHSDLSSLCGLGIVRYILDNANSADDAIDLLNNRNIWMPHSSLFNNEFHFMIADDTKTYIVEFIQNQMKVIEDASIMTNFYLYNVIPNSDGSVYTPYTQTTSNNAIITNHITPFGSGLERFNIAANKIDDISTASDMTELMQSLYYTQSYTNSPDEDSWYTEFVGINNLTVTSSTSDYTPTMQKAYQQFTNRDRNQKATWQTVHTSIYNISGLSVDIYCQEGTTKHTFSLS